MPRKCSSSRKSENPYLGGPLPPGLKGSLFYPGRALAPALNGSVFCPGSVFRPAQQASVCDGRHSLAEGPGLKRLLFLHWKRLGWKRRLRGPLFSSRSSALGLPSKPPARIGGLGVRRCRLPLRWEAGMGPLGDASAPGHLCLNARLLATP